MKHLLKGFFLFTLLTQFAYAQQTDTLFFSPKHHWEIGLNATSVISNFVGNKPDETLSPGNYPLFIKWLPSAKHAMRIAVGGKYNLKNTASFVGNPFEIQDFSNALNAKVGYEHRHALGKRWILQLGVDVLGQYRASSINTNTSIDQVATRERVIAGGAGPFMGFQFALNKRIHLGCESSLYGIYESGTDDKRFKNNPSLDELRNFETFSFTYNIPKWLYVVIRL